MDFRIVQLEEITSSNDYAAEATKKGADDGLVIWALRQTKGRGQKNRAWESQPQSSLTFSVLFRLKPEEYAVLGRFTALGALAVARALKSLAGVEALVKWPNDVLLNGRKICGVLAEADVQAGAAGSVVVGVGINLLPGAFDTSSAMNFPASDVFTETSVKVNAENWLWRVLGEMNALRSLLVEEDFTREWNEHLAFRGELRNIRNHKGETGEFRLLGILTDGSLCLEDADGQRFSLQSAEVLPSPSSSSSASSG